MKKLIVCVLTVVLLLSLVAGCTSSLTGMDRDQQEAEDSGLTLHKIGVATYNLKDAQIMMFKEYLDSYIKACFPDVTFLYSAGISGSEGLMDFLALCAENDVEGVMLFGSYDLQKEVEFCAENGMYLIRPAATSCYYESMIYVIDLVWRALAPAFPESLGAGHLLSVCTVLMAGCCLGVLAAPAANWLVLCSAVIVVASVIAWVLLLTHKKPVREAAGLRWHGGAGALGYVALFLALRTASVFISMALAGQLGGYAAYWMTAAPWVTMLMLVPNFFLSFLPFFGEEYGWRYFLQPRLQSRFGPRGGVLLLGVLWGLWHLPLNLFYYAPDTALQSVASQLVTCVCFGVFFAWAYMRTNNIWTAVLLHYFNNNMILVYTGAGDAAVISGQTVGWGDVLVQLALFGALFLPFLASKTFRETSGKGEL